MDTGWRAGIVLLTRLGGDTEKGSRSGGQSYNLRLEDLLA